MKVTSEVTLRQFDAWSGAKETKQTILDNNMSEEFDQLIEECYPDGIDETQLNDILWFDSEWCFEMLGIKEEDE